MPATVYHSKTVLIPDAADTSIVRPSDWNSSHVVSLSLNTSEALAVSAAGGSLGTGVLVFSNSHNVSFGLATNTHGATLTATASQSVQPELFNILSLSGNTDGTLATFSQATMILAGGNNITLSQDGHTVLIEGPVTSPQSNQSVGLYAVGNTTGVSSMTADARSLSVDGAGVASVGFSNGSLVISAAAGTGADLYNIVSIDGNTAGGPLSTFSQDTIVFLGGNNITLSQSSNSVVISGPTTHDNFNILSLGGNTAGTLTTFSSTTLVLAGGNNVTLSQNGASVTISGANTVAQTVQTIGLFAVGNTTGTSSTTVDARSLSIDGAGVATVGFSNGSLVVSASVPVATDVFNVISLAGNTAGTLTTFSNTTVVLAGGNNVTLSQNGAGITISGPNTVAQTAQTIGLFAVGNTGGQSSATTADARSLSFDGAGIASVGFSNGSVLISVTAAPGDGGNVVSASGNTAGTLTTFSTGTLVLAGGSNITLSQSSNTISIIGATAAGDGGNVLTIGGNTTGTATSFSTGQFLFAGGNNITLSQSSNSVTISGPNTAAQSVQTYNVVSASGNTSGTLTTFSTGTFVLAGGNNITLSQNSNSLTISGPNTSAQSAQTLGLYFAGNTTGQSSSFSTDARTLSFDGAGNVSVGMSGNSVVISAPLNTFNVLSASGNTSGTLATFSSGNVVLAGGNNITLSQSSNSITISGPNTAAQSVQTYNVVSASGNTAGTLTTFSTGTMVLAGGNNITLSQSSNSLTISGPNTSAQSAQTLGVYFVGNTTGQSSSFTGDARTLSFNGAGIASVGYSNGSVLISAVGGGAGDGGNILSASGNTSGTLTTFSSGTVVLAGGNNITLSQSSNSITISGGLAPVTLSAWEPYPAFSSNMSLSSQQQNTLQFIPFNLPAAVSFQRVNLLQQYTLSTGASASIQCATKYSLAFYSRDAGNSASLAQAVSSSIGVTVSFNSNVSAGFTYGALTASSAGVGLSSQLSGAKLMSIPCATSLSAGEWWLALALSTASTGSGNHSLNLQHLFFFNPPIGLLGSLTGTIASMFPEQGFGQYSVSSNAFPASVALSQISFRTGNQPYFNLLNAGTAG